MKNSIVFMLFIFLIGNLTGQTLQDHFSQLEGEWSGTLTYTDFSDDLSTSTLICSMNAEWEKNKGIISIGFEEPNGKVYYDKAKIKIYDDDKSVKFDGVLYSIDEFTNDTSMDNWKLILTTIGKDNRRSALIKQSIVLEGERLSLIKEIKYDGTDEFFTRNIYNFKKE